jgi:hypothetical protein
MTNRTNKQGQQSRHHGAKREEREGADAGAAGEFIKDGVAHFPVIRLGKHLPALFLQLSQDGDGGIVIDLVRSWRAVFVSTSRHDSRCHRDGANDKG